MTTSLVERFKSIAECDDLGGKYVLVRSDLNVPIVDGKVINDFRIRKALLTIQLLQNRGARVIIISHASRVGEEEAESMAPIFEELSKHLEVSWGGDVLSKEAADAVAAMTDGQVVMMENLRRYVEEKANDAAFAKHIASLGDIYVNDAFADSHRTHASIVGVPKHLPSYAGLLLIDEVSHLREAREPERPALFVLGGAKFDTKLPLLTAFIEKYDRVFVGGALANDFFKARGYEIGKSLSSPVDLKESPLLNHPHLLLPIDVTVLDEQGARAIRQARDVLPGDTILDAGPETIDMLREQIRFAKTVLWNGPLGDYEQGFSDQTVAFAQCIAETGNISIIGGGDTIASIEQLYITDRFTFLSTGGGAMLTFLEQGTLPGIDALTRA